VDLLREYSHRLTTVEGNTTFYAVPSAETVVGRAEQTPSGFQFCPKLPQTITLAKRLVDAQQDAELFLERKTGLRDRLGPLFIQLPPGIAPAVSAALSDFLGLLPSRLRVCVEVRQRGWFTAATRPRLNVLLSQHSAARVTIDTRGVPAGGDADAGIKRSRTQKPDLSIQTDVTADFALVRLIAHPHAELNGPVFAEWT
jgi:uncharacterized protein YecE (DUF72 family)